MTLPPKLQQAWDKAAETGEAVPVGRIVVCDWCDADFTDSSVEGGFVFMSKAVCPGCAPRVEREAKQYHEEHHIRSRCPSGQSFADFVRAFRGPDAAVKVMRVR